MTDAFWNLAAYSVQLAALTVIAHLALRATRLRMPQFTLHFWQAILGAALVLPFLQLIPSTSSGPTLTASSSIFPSATRDVVTSAVSDQALITAAWTIAVVAALRLLWLAAGLVRIRTLVAKAEPHAALAAHDALKTAIGTRAALLITDDLDGPATVGVRCPVVLLPRSVLSMPEAVQRAIVCHELVHVRRRDWLHTIGEEIWCAALWFHPAARVIASSLSLSREIVVDDITLAHTRDRRAYAEALLAFADPQPHVIGITPFIGRRTLSHRISQIAEEDSMSRRRSLASLAVALVASAAVTAATAERFPMAVAGAPVEQGQVYEPGPGISLPEVIHEVKPGYTRAAMDAKIQGSVWMWVVVNQSGDVTNVDIKGSLDDVHGLDAKAIEAAYKWKFKPSMKDGKTVSSRVTLQMTFTLK